ncbi:hypothetical protein IKF81_03690 [Candidatus Saccharibacteria bacterium]|nr:hypothetical protein [Candidatus Saccharibacteria bacterium]
MKKKPRFFRGDTLIEIMISVAVFSMVSVGAIQIMNRGVYSSQEALEVTMARSEIDAQAEALRFIHEAYISNMSDSNDPYAVLWQKIISKAYNNNGNTPSGFNLYENHSCADIYEGNSGGKTNAIPANNSFVIVPRYLGNADIRNHLNDILAMNDSLTRTPTYPRLFYVNSDSSALLDDNSLYNSSFSSAQGIWVTAVASAKLVSGKPEFYDFYIRTCWDAPDGKSTSNTVSSIIRLYNPIESP